MVFQGEVQSVAELIDAAVTAPAPTLSKHVGIHHTAADNAGLGQ